MKAIQKYFMFIVTVAGLCCCDATAQNGKGTIKNPWNSMEYGAYKVGFKTMRMMSKSGNPMLISVWYPAADGGTLMTLENYVVKNKFEENTPDSLPVNDLKQTLELPFLYKLGKIPMEVFKRALKLPTRSFDNAVMREGKYPLVIAASEPESFFSNFEYLASHGFIVAAWTPNEQPPNNDTLMYTNATNRLEELMDYMTSRNFADKERVSVFGYGWGSQAAFYLAMRRQLIRSFINLDGGIFGPRSKTTLSPDYHPSKLQAPMLHVVTQSQLKEDDLSQVAALSNTRYAVTIKSPVLSHHDLSVYGRIVLAGLKLRGEEAERVDKIFTGVNQLILSFLQTSTIDLKPADPLFEVKVYK